MKRWILAAMVLAMVASSSIGCNRYAWHLAADIVTTAATVALLTAVLHDHDSHYHHDDCGHYYVYVEDWPVYHYRERWEYYDECDGRWYYYPDGVPHDGYYDGGY